MKNTLFALALLCVSAPAFAQTVAPSTNTRQFKTTAGSALLLDGVALNASAATRTITIPVYERLAKLLVFVDLTRSAATTLDATYLCNPPNSAVYFERQSVSVSAGTATLTDLAYTKAVSGNTALYIEADARGCRNVKMVFSGTSGGASDLIDVMVTGVTGS